MHHRPDTIDFVALQDGRTMIVSCSADAPWRDLAENFLDFLKGTGYGVEAKDLAEYFEERSF